MTNPVALSPLLAERFCELCSNAYIAWRAHRDLFDDNPNIKREKADTPAKHAFGMLSTVTQAHLLLETLKLHDPATSGGKVTLTIDFVMRFGGWSDRQNARLKPLVAQLEKFAKPLRGVRNQRLAHNDLGAILAWESMGEFEKDKDVAYFEVLEQFGGLVHEFATGRPWHFPHQVKEQFAALANSIDLDAC